MNGNGTEKPISTSSGSKNDKRFTWLARALPAFHCVLIGIAFTLASFRFFITGELDARPVLSVQAVQISH